MQVWPAIDLLGGKCVRLQQGDYSRETVFSDDPVSVAHHWRNLGATCLHLVDLDGAKSGSLINQPAIRGIVTETGLTCQVGGGVRDQETIDRLLYLGVTRVIVGTRALREPQWFAEMTRLYPKQLVLGIDARDGMVATDGWLETSSISATALAQRIETLTDLVAAIVYTDIAKDGMLSGPNYEQLAQMQRCSAFPVIASGGVTTLDDIDQLVEMKTHGCIVGRSLYEGWLQLPDALRRARREEGACPH